MRFTKTFALVLGCMILTNCATIIHGSKQKISFSSNPSGAEVLIDGQSSGQTPLSLKLPRDKECAVKISLPGYLPYETNLVRSVDGWVYGNIVIGGLIGIIIDASTGAIYKLSPGEVYSELKKTDAVFRQKGGDLFVTVAMKVDPSHEKIGALQKN